jgi:hypothetical protein
MAVRRYFKTKAANAAKDNDDVNIPAGMTVIINQIDFTAPAQQSAGVKVFIGPTGSPNTVVAAGQGDKVIPIPQADGMVEGPKTIRCQLDNSNNPNGAFLGCVIYYEEL